MSGFSKQSTSTEAPSTGVQGMMNRKFFGKKAVKPKGKALQKASAEKNAAQKLG